MRVCVCVCVLKHSFRLLTATPNTVENNNLNDLDAEVPSSSTTEPPLGNVLYAEVAKHPTYLTLEDPREVTVPSIYASLRLTDRDTNYINATATALDG